MDGNQKITLGLIWIIILRFQVSILNNPAEENCTSWALLVHFYPPFRSKSMAFEKFFKNPSNVIQVSTKMYLQFRTLSFDPALGP